MRTFLLPSCAGWRELSVSHALCRSTKKKKKRWAELSSRRSLATAPLFSFINVQRVCVLSFAFNTKPPMLLKKKKSSLFYMIAKMLTSAAQNSPPPFWSFLSWAVGSSSFGHKGSLSCKLNINSSRAGVWSLSTLAYPKKLVLKYTAQITQGRKKQMKAFGSPSC